MINEHNGACLKHKDIPCVHRNKPAAESNKGGFPVKNASYWRKQSIKHEEQLMVANAILEKVVSSKGGNIGYLLSCDISEYLDGIK